MSATSITPWFFCCASSEVAKSFLDALEKTLLKYLCQIPCRIII